MLIRHTWLYLPAQIIGPAVQFISVLAWAHLLPLEEVGKTTLVVAMQELLFAGFFMWWSHSVLRFLRRYQSALRHKEFLRTELVALLISCVLQTLFVSIFSRIYFGEIASLKFHILTATFALTRSLVAYFSERARAYEAIWNYTFLQGIVPLAGLILSVFMALHWAATAENMLAAMILVQGIGVCATILTSDFSRSAGFVKFTMLREAASFGIPVSIGSMLSALALNSPRFLVDHSLGLAAAGIFAVSYGLGLRASSFAVMLVTAGAYPLAVRKMETEGIEAAHVQLGANMMLVATTVAPVACGLIGVNASVIQVMMPQSMHEQAYWLLPLATICGLFRYLRSHTTDQVFLLSSRPDIIMKMSIIDLVLSTALTLLGLHYFGMVGAIIGPLTTAVSMWVASLIIAYGFGFKLPLWTFIRILIAATTMMIAVWFLPDTNSWQVLAMQVAFGGICYALLLMAMFPSVVRNSLMTSFNRV